MMHQYDAMSQRWIMTDLKALTLLTFYVLNTLCLTSKACCTLIFLEDEFI